MTRSWSTLRINAKRWNLQRLGRHHRDTRVALIRRFITEQLEFINFIASRYAASPTSPNWWRTSSLRATAAGKSGGRGQVVSRLVHPAGGPARPTRIETLPLVPRTEFIRSDGVPGSSPTANLGVHQHQVPAGGGNPVRIPAHRKDIQERPVPRYHAGRADACWRIRGEAHHRTVQFLAGRPDRSAFSGKYKAFSWPTRDPTAGRTDQRRGLKSTPFYRKILVL